MIRECLEKIVESVFGLIDWFLLKIDKFVFNGYSRGGVREIITFAAVVCGICTVIAVFILGVLFLIFR